MTSTTKIDNQDVGNNHRLVYIALSLATAVIDIAFLNAAAVVLQHSIAMWVNVVMFIAIAIIAFLAFSMCCAAGGGDEALNDRDA